MFAILRCGLPTSGCTKCQCIPFVWIATNAQTARMQSYSMLSACLPAWVSRAAYARSIMDYSLWFKQRAQMADRCPHSTRHDASNQKNHHRTNIAGLVFGQANGSSTDCRLTQFCSSCVLYVSLCVCIRASSACQSHRTTPIQQTVKCFVRFGASAPWPSAIPKDIYIKI